MAVSTDGSQIQIPMYLWNKRLHQSFFPIQGTHLLQPIGSSTVSLLLHVVRKAADSSRRNQHLWTWMRKWKLTWHFPGSHITLSGVLRLPFPWIGLLWFWYPMIFIFKPNQDWQKLCMKNCLLLRSNLQAYLLYSRWTASLYAILNSSCLKVCVHLHIPPLLTMK